MAEPTADTARQAVRDRLAGRVARDIPEGWYVNLGIGIPTTIADHVPPEREVIFHSENGILGVGPAPPEHAINRWLVNAGKHYVSLRTGGAYMHHADSFAIICGGHLDLCVLGGYEVAENGDLANWATQDRDAAPAVGGAMDLAIGARRIWIVMEHLTRNGQPRLVRQCAYPVTALGCVKRIYTDLAVIDVEATGFVVRELADGIGFEDLQAKTGALLRRGADLAR